MFQEDWSDYEYRQMPMMPLMPPPMMGAGFNNPYGEMPDMSRGMTPHAQNPLPSGSTGPADFEYEPGAPVQTSTQYTQGYLKTHIGDKVKITFLIGTNLLVDRSGILLNVGISYIILRDEQTENLVLCDIYSIKFVNIYK